MSGSPGASQRVLSGRAGLGVLYAATGLSGIAGLGYEMLWTRMLAVSLGHEVIAVLAVVAAFFVGLALGAWGLWERIQNSPRPERWYAALEGVIGAWALALIYLIPKFNSLMPQWMGVTPSAFEHWGLAFGSTLLLLLPATLAMGATLPALERLLTRTSPSERHVAGLYAANTFGAMAGTLLATFWLAPKLGYSSTLLCFAALNAFGAGLVLAFLRTSNAGAAETPRSVAAVTAHAHEGTESIGRNRLIGTLFTSGLLGVGYEVLVVRTLSLVLEGTVYTFASLLAVYLFGTALGATLFQHWTTRRAARGRARENDATLDLLLALTSACCLLGLLCLWQSPAVERAALNVLGAGLSAGLVRELAVAAFIFLLPAACMGALFSHLAQLAVPRIGLGPALGVNTAGAACAPLLIGIVLLPSVGSKVALVLVSGAYLLLMPGLAKGQTSRAALPASLAAAIGFFPVPLQFADLSAGGELLVRREGVMGAVSVLSDRSGARYLQVNDQLTMGGTASQFSDQRQAHIPLLLHGAAERALFLGVGTGMTLDAAKDYPNLRATGVELVPEILELLPHFGTDPSSRNWSRPPTLLAADARRFVLSSRERYDVVIAELFHPWTDGAGSLYTAEHFAAVRARLAPGGLFCQWLPLYQLDADTLMLIVRTFLREFPAVQAHLGHYSLEQPILALIGSAGPLPSHGPGWLEPRVAHPELQRRLVELRLNSDFALFGGFVGDGPTLAKFAGEGAVNTDDYPSVGFRAPAFAYAVQPPASTLLLELIAATHAGRATGALQAALGSRRAPTREEADFLERLARYWTARDAYLRAGVGVKPNADLREMLERTKRPLLDVVRLSPDFAPAYVPLLGMARELYPEHPAQARELLTELADANPLRPEARGLRRRLFGD